jgi:integrase
LGRPEAPRPYQTEKTKAWTDDEKNVILDAIAAEAERGSIYSLRDYAVTLFYLFSGLRRNDNFGLRGSDIEPQEDGLIVRYKRKGGKYQRREVSDADVCEALIAYLKKSKNSQSFTPASHSGLGRIAPASQACRSHLAPSQTI